MGKSVERDKMIEENDRAFGGEVRAAYGDHVMDAANERMRNMNQAAFDRREKLAEQIDDALKAAMATGDPAGEAAQRVCEMHKEWLCMSWPEGMYTKEMHRGLGETYATDKRFKDYYDQAAGEGAAEFLEKALEVFTRE